MRNSCVVFILLTVVNSLGAQSGFWTPVVPPRAHYSIECAFDTGTALLKGGETIVFRNTTMRSMDRLALDWSIGPETTVSAVANGIPAALMLPPDQNKTPAPLLLQLPQPLKPAAAVELRVEFSTVYKKDFDPVRGLLLYGWYPKLWWGFGTQDDYTVRMTVPPGWSLVTSGVFDPSSGLWTGKDIRNFAGMIFNETQYSVEHEKAGDVQVTVIHTAAGVKCAQLVLQTAVDVIGFYRGRFGFYPHKSLTIIPGQDFPSGGYAVGTAMVAIHGEEQMDKKPEAHFRWITAHEIGHMYWSQYVLGQGPYALDWLMIGLGVFADHEYRRARGIAEPIGNLPARYIDGMKEGVDTTMDLTPAQEELIEWDFNNIVEHGKSSAMIDALESTIGKVPFDRAYRRCLREYGGRRMNWHAFETVCEEESGEDLGWFFESWVRTNDYASYQLVNHDSTHTPVGWHSEVEVLSKGTRLQRVPVIATFTDGAQQTEYTDRLGEVSIMVFESKSPIKEVKLDPGICCGCSTRSPRSRPETWNSRSSE